MDHNSPPVCPKYEAQTVDEGEDEYDPQLHFAQFLKEAKTHACQDKSVASSAASGIQELVGMRRKHKKSWKSCIFSWLKADKKTVVVEERQPPKLKSPYTKSKTTRGYVSGPINGMINGRNARWLKRTTSGPLSGGQFFNQRKGMGEMPCVTLGQLNNSPGSDLQAYGPVYLVT